MAQAIEHEELKYKINLSDIELNEEEFLLEFAYVTDIYSAVFFDLFLRMVKRLRVRGTQDLIDDPYIWQMQRMNDMHALNEEVLDVIIKESGVAETALRNAIENEGLKVYQDTKEQLSEDRESRKYPEDNQVQEMLIHYSNQTMDELDNLVNTTLPKEIQEQYKAIVEEAVAKVVSGTMTAEQAISETVMKWYDNGFTGFTDKAGRRWMADVYARTIITSTAYRTYNEARIAAAREMGIDTFYYSIKPAARAMCAPIQHQIVTINGETEKIDDVMVYSLKDYGYGTASGCLGINCRHTLTPFIIGLNEKPELGPDVKGLTPEKAQENAKAQAKQRGFEREIRKNKERQAIAKELGDTELEDYYRAKVRTLQMANKKHIEEHPFLYRDYAREKYSKDSITHAKEETKLKEEKTVLDKRREFENGIIGLETSDGQVIKGITHHLAERIVQRGGTVASVTDALQNPLEVTDVKYDKEGKPSKQYRGKVTTVVINPENGNVVSTNPTRRNIRKRHGVN